ncbi:MAG: choline ABC transporter permease subunit [Candidatus Pacebacteria bacterium]|nr:choline ABC transporter permease subunit [Candidatus Paceibacterota bacterium]
MFDLFYRLVQWLEETTKIISDHKIPFGDYMTVVIKGLTENASGFFDIIKLGLNSVIQATLFVVASVPPLVMVVLMVTGVWFLHRAIVLTIMTLLSLILIINLGYWQAMNETLALVVWSTLVCIMIGVPLGIAAAHRPVLYNFMRPILDLMQTIPTFVYLIPTLVLFGLGVVPGLISTAIFALPAPIRLTHLGVSAVPQQMVEAGKAFGATKRQLLWKVELPYAMPTIMAGVTQCIMLSLSMVVIAALVGADGLGKPVVRALNTVNLSMGFEAGMAIVILAILLDRICKLPEPRSQKNPKGGH